MGSKLTTPALLVLHFIKDFTLEPQAAVGAVDLGDLPENFIVDSVYMQELADVTAGTTIAVGPTASPAGFVAAVAPAGIQKGAGALLGADAADTDYVVPAAQKLLITTAVNPAVVGKVAVFVKGFQAF